jgi:antitoxin ParD1/3/4
MRTRKSTTDAFGTQRAKVEWRLREKVKASMADPRPSVPVDDVFRRLRTRQKWRVKAANNGAQNL